MILSGSTFNWPYMGNMWQGALGGSAPSSNSPAIGSAQSTHSNHSLGLSNHINQPTPVSTSHQTSSLSSSNSFASNFSFPGLTSAFSTARWPLITGSMSTPFTIQGHRSSGLILWEWSISITWQYVSIKGYRQLRWWVVEFREISTASKHEFNTTNKWSEK